MQIRTVDVNEAQANLRELLCLVLEGTEIVLTEGDTPLEERSFQSLPNQRHHVKQDYMLVQFGQVMTLTIRYLKSLGCKVHEALIGYPYLYLVG